MSSNVVDRQEKMAGRDIERIAWISQKIREAIRNALPAPPEQFFHVMVPGKVVNFADFVEGFDEDGNQTTITLPTVTELNQAILCDDMPALAPVQLGPTGRSVSRSYGATLSKLVPSATTVGVEIADADNLSDAEKRYRRAMDWLLAEDDRNPGKSHLDSYIIKQKLYTEAEERKIKKFDDAYNRIMNDPFLKTFVERRVAYEKWVNENGRSLRIAVEGAYKDWVIHGRKEAVEYWFAVVDNDSAMARVEQSKEAMRNSVVMNTDGSLVYPKVRLTPSNWAWIARRKMLFGVDGTRTVSQVTWEISNLEKKNRMIEVLQKNPPRLTGYDGGPPSDPGLTKANEALSQALTTYITKYTERDNIIRRSGGKEQIEEASKEAANAKQTLDEAFTAYDKNSLERVSAMSLKVLHDFFGKPLDQLNSELKENNDKIRRLETERQLLLNESIGDPSNTILNDMFSPGMPKAKDGGKPARGSRGISTASNIEDYFTAITVEVSSTFESSKTSQHTVDTASRTSFRWGIFGLGSAERSNSFHSSTSDAESQMANSDVRVSFECMRVDINRSWLRPELFYDEELRAAPGSHISPGQMRLAALMDPDNNVEIGSKIEPKEREEELQRYSLFPLYPTAFLLACNVVLEISGDTSAIQSHFDTTTTKSASSFSFGPFSVSKSKTETKENTSASCETTSTGCRITIRSPQIIGWISELVPALPRKDEENTPLSSRTDPTPLT